MLQKLQLLLFTALLTTTFVLCAGCEKNKADMKTIADADNGTTVSLAKGESFRIRLKSQMSTGFSWQVTKSPQIVSLQGKPEVEVEKRAEKIVGGVDHQVFTFTAAKEGDGAIDLAYARPWEKKVKPARTFSVKISIK